MAINTISGAHDALQVASMSLMPQAVNNYCHCQFCIKSEKKVFT